MTLKLLFTFLVLSLSLLTQTNKLSQLNGVTFEGLSRVDDRAAVSGFQRAAIRNWSSSNNATGTRRAQLAQSSKTRSDSVGEQQSVEIRRKVLAPAISMLKKHRVRFDPKILVYDDWRQQLAPSLPLMPEMTKTIHVEGSLSGVYIAGTVLLPEQVVVDGDTFILAQELAPDDENSSITIIGEHQLFIFNIGDSKKFAAMIRKRPRGHFLNITVEAPCAIVGIAPMYLGRYHCKGMGYFGGIEKPRTN